jgi:hypothetical protein
MPPRKHTNIRKRATNLHDLQKDDLRRTVLKYYDDGEFPVLRNITLAPREKKT